MNKLLELNPHKYIYFLRDVIFTTNIDIEDIYDTTEVNIAATTTTTVTPGQPGIIALPVDEDGSPLEGAKVTLQCTDPPRDFIGVENSVGEYIFEYGIPGDGRIVCELAVEKEG